ncbi:MAG: O-antigen ligase family protein [Planctomycetes bacterium]|nr:O-antigen ligase family protein [Planctomycetota bacterium]
MPETDIAQQRFGLAPRKGDAAGEAQVAGLGSAALTALLCGELLLRRGFAHRSLGETFGAALERVYVTEFALALLLPGALFLWLRRRPAVPGLVPLVLFLIWGAGHAVAGFTHGEAGLVFRQSALAAYASFYLLGAIYFANAERAFKRAAVAVLGTAVALALLDTIAHALLDAAPLRGLENLYFGQCTLAAGVLGFGYAAVCVKGWARRKACLLALALLLWRQAQHVQSAVALGLVAAMAGLLVLGALAAWKAESVNASRCATLRRSGALAAALTLCAGLSAFVLRGGEAGRESAAWNPSLYSQALGRYEAGKLEESARDGWPRGRGPDELAPEAARLYAALDELPSPSAKNNAWRLLVWRCILSDGLHGHPIRGAGVGRAWRYEALSVTNYFSGDPHLGLDSHNSYLALLYRYGVVGIALLVWWALAWLRAVWAALRRGSDPWLEGALLFCFYGAAFASVTVALEGPAYAVPLWLAAGLAAARSGSVDFRERADTI